MNLRKIASCLGKISLLTLASTASADNNPHNKNDLAIQLNNGQTVQIHWHSETLTSGPTSDNPFLLKIWNTQAGADRLEDLKGSRIDDKGILDDFFTFSMTDMTMPDPSKTYKKPRQILRKTQGLYEVTDSLFSMDSMKPNDWQIEIIINHKSLGSGTFTVGM